VGLVAAVLWLALAPSPPDTLDTGWDKLNHVLAFGALAFAGRFALAPARRAALWDGVALAVLGVAIELLQQLVPTRSAQWQDLLADALGIAAGLLAAALAGAALRRARSLSL
jgi:VanZ family protein